MFEKLVNIICNYVEVEPENVHPDSRFMEDLGFTSFDFMSMLGNWRTSWTWRSTSMRPPISARFRKPRIIWRN